ncbi:MAG: cytochrome c [Hyphomicrobiaceae bacterium]
MRPVKPAFVLIAMLAASPLAVSPAMALDAPADVLAAGRAILSKNCARCHAIDKEGESPLAKAPAFRTLGQRYAIDTLGEGLAEGLVTAHEDMPEIVFEPDQIDQILAYLQSIQVEK